MSYNFAYQSIVEFAADLLKGEKYFATKLIDYDPLVNNGNWQWAGGTGCDRYTNRIFNPWIQSSKFDKEAEYIKTYLPQLRKIPAKGNGVINRKFFLNTLLNNTYTSAFTKIFIPGKHLTKSTI